MDREELIRLLRAGHRPKYLFFWGHRPLPNGEVGKPCFSQWYAASFAVDGVTYPTAEHFMMAEKARLFGDEEMREAILQSGGPGAAKRFGRAVRGFDEERWNAARCEIVVRGNLAKFARNPPLRDYLLTTGDRVLVEASPRDRIWGIGMGASNPLAEDPEQWRGLNLLGFALMEVRDRLRGG